MRRRDFLKVTGSAVTAGGTALVVGSEAATAAPSLREAAANAPRRVRLVTDWPDSTHGPGDHVHRFARRLCASMGERWTIDVESGRQTRPATHDMRSSRVAAAMPAEPAAAYFDGLPSFTGLDAEGLSSWLNAAGGQELLDELGARHGVKPLLIGHTGAPLSLWSSVPIESADDFKGRRVAVQGLARDLVKGLGGVAVDIAPDAVAPALADGSVDIAEAPDASLATRVALAASGATGYLTPFNPDGAAIVLHVPLASWWSLAPADRIVIGALAAEAFAAQRDELLAEQSLARDLIGHVPRLAATPTAVSAIVSRLAADAVAGIAGHDPLCRRISHSYMAFRDRHRRRESFLAG